MVPITVSDFARGIDKNVIARPFHVLLPHVNLVAIALSKSSHVTVIEIKPHSSYMSKQSLERPALLSCSQTMIV